MYGDIGRRAESGRVDAAVRLRPAAFALGAILGFVAGAMLENWGTLFMGLFLGFLSPVAIFIALFVFDSIWPAFGL